jgi:hypothetical protein
MRPPPSFARSLSLPRRPILAGTRDRRIFLGASSPDDLMNNGALIKVKVGMPKDIADSLAKQGKPVPNPVEALAMIDTGASITALDAALAQQIGLTQTGLAPIAGVTGTQNQPVYAAKLMLDQPSVQLDPWTMIGSPLQVQHFQVLLGRDFLEQLTLVYDGSSGNFQLTPGKGGAATAEIQSSSGGSSFSKWAGGILASSGILTAVGFVTKIFKS